MLRGRDQTERDHTALVKGRAVGRADPRGTRAAQAPAVGMPMLVLLALALSVGAAYVLRRKAASATARLAVVAAATVLAGIAYTPHPQRCGQQRSVQDTNDPDVGRDCRCGAGQSVLECAADRGHRHRMRCRGNPALAPCVVGRSLAGGAACHLPVCA
jgi:hypothetical protein